MLTSLIALADSACDGQNIPAAGGQQTSRGKHRLHYCMLARALWRVEDHSVGMARPVAISASVVDSANPLGRSHA